VIFAALSSAQRKTIGELYRSHGAMVLRRARQITGNEHEAEEVVQEIFGKLLEEPESLDRARNPTAWLYGATTHLCLNRIRNRKNRERLLKEKVMPVEGEQRSAETAALVQQALEALPEELSAAFVYYYLDQMTHSEIAGILGCSRRQVGNLLERAHAKLERLVGPSAGARHE
jgi:RNA polymerase sigma-70 factor (ECF subfamily)